MDKTMLWNEELPVVTEYNDKYENTELEEVIAAAEAEDPVAIYELGYRYRCGEGGATEDTVKAMEMYGKVLHYQRNTGAMYRLGYACLIGALGEDRVRDSIDYFEAAVELGDASSAVQLGLIYEDGELVPQDYDKALELYFFAIDNGRKDAYYNAGEIYRYRNMPEKAIEYYNISMENGDTMAAWSLGLYYDNGIGVEKDEKKAFELYKLAYEDGNPTSIFYLGRMYYLGRGTEENDAEAFKLFTEASENGYKDANCFLGVMYAYGVEGVVEKNIEKALEYLSDVTENYEINAWHHKGCIYANEGNMEEALVWLGKAAEAGNEDSQNVIDQIKAPRKSLKEIAEEGKDPNAMMQYTAFAFTNPDQGGFNEAMDTITRANQLFPDNLEVKEMYARFTFLKGHIGRKIGDENGAYISLKVSIETVDFLKQHNFMSDKVRETEVDACMELAEMAYKRDENDLALNMLARTDVKKYPYASVIRAMIHFSDCGRFGAAIPNDISEIHSLLGNSNWREAFEEASAYFALSIVYAYGVQGYVPSNVPYAYECIQKCASIDSDLAAAELRKYSKGFLGKITYRY